jgi:hypothetical protein
MRSSAVATLALVLVAAGCGGSAGAPTAASAPALKPPQVSANRIASLVRKHVLPPEAALRAARVALATTEAVCGAVPACKAAAIAGVAANASVAAVLSAAAAFAVCAGAKAVETYTRTGSLKTTAVETTVACSVAAAAPAVVSLSAGVEQFVSDTRKTIEEKRRELAKLEVRVEEVVEDTTAAVAEIDQATQSVVDQIRGGQLTLAEALARGLITIGEAIEANLISAVDAIRQGFISCADANDAGYLPRLAPCP